MIRKAIKKIEDIIILANTYSDKDNEKLFFKYLDITYNILCFAFAVFAIISLYFFINYEILNVR